jgi:anti-sigma-K factor RskA
MNHEDWLAQADIYALGALDGGELTAFEAHLAAGCPVCEHHIVTTREALTLLPRSLEPLTPSAGVRERLLAQIAADAAVSRPVTRLPRRRWWLMGVSALAAAGLLIALSIKMYQTRQELLQERGIVAALRAELAQRDAALRAEQQEVQRIQAQVAALQAELATREDSLEAERRELQRIERVVATLQSELSEREAALRLLSAPQVRPVRLAGLPPSPGASGLLWWNREARTGVLLTSGLPRISGNQVYELWAIAGKELVPAGIFGVDEAGQAVLRLPPLPKTKRFDKFAVTIEPAGGVPEPTGAMHLLGSL